jgi:ribosomal-protein-alanine N-acetyltransferase
MTMTATLPILRSSRLVLRPFEAADAPRVQLLLADNEVAKQTLTIPHPYPEGAAAEWIAKHEEWLAAGKQAIWAITRDGQVMGAMGLRVVAAHLRAEVGYWVAREVWGQGIASEALRAVIAHGFNAMGLHRIEAHHYPENPASGRVMEKAGMMREGHLRGVVFRDGVPRDNVVYGILRGDPRP